MTFTYEQVSKEDLKKPREYVNTLFKKGIYDFEVIKKTFKMSKANNPMIELLIRIKDGEGNQNIVNDWLVSMPSMQWKTRVFCECTGILDIYERNEFNENLDVPLKGKVAISIEEGKVRPITPEDPSISFYPDKNVVDYYITEESEGNITFIQNASPQAAITKDAFDDDIPF